MKSTADIAVGGNKRLASHRLMPSNGHFLESEGYRVDHLTKRDSAMAPTEAPYG
jgi:hypothetical protein